MAIILCALGLFLLAMFHRPLLVLYVRLVGVPTTATLKIYRSTVEVRTTGISGTPGAKNIGSWQELRASGVYKANRLRYEATPLNEYHALRYRNHQTVTIRYLRRHPKCFVVLEPLAEEQ